MEEKIEFIEKVIEKSIQNEETTPDQQYWFQIGYITATDDSIKKFIEFAKLKGLNVSEEELKDFIKQ